MFIVYTINVYKSRYTEYERRKEEKTMKRNVKKHIEEYQKRFVYGNEENAKTTFYTSDFEQIRELSAGNYFYSIDNALMFGFMMGVRYAENRKEK